MAKKLNKQQRDFCRFKAQGYSNEESAVKAGYSKTTAKTKSHLWIEKSEIKAEIERLQVKVQEVIEKKFEYAIEKSFAKLEEIQSLALLKSKKGEYNNLASAVKAEELKAKLGGCFVLDNTQRIPKLPDINISGL